MAHFAEIDSNNIVIRVIVVEPDIIKLGEFGNPKNWIQTSYNTSKNTHSNGKTPLRKNYAGIGFTYNKDKDYFIAPKPYPSWIINHELGIYESPIPEPDFIEGKHFSWNELNQIWDIKE
jgi:hypothetical protein